MAELMQADHDAASRVLATGKGSCLDFRRVSQPCGYTVDDLRMITAPTLISSSATATVCSLDEGVAATVPCKTATRRAAEHCAWDQPSRCAGNDRSSSAAPLCRASRDAAGLPQHRPLGRTPHPHTTAPQAAPAAPAPRCPWPRSPATAGHWPRAGQRPHRGQTAHRAQTINDHRRRNVLRHHTRGRSPRSTGMPRPIPRRCNLSSYLIREDEANAPCTLMPAPAYRGHQGSPTSRSGGTPRKQGHQDELLSGKSSSPALKSVGQHGAAHPRWGAEYIAALTPS